MTLAALRAQNLILGAAHQLFELVPQSSHRYSKIGIALLLLARSYSRSAIAILSIQARTSECGAEKSFTRIENASRPCVLLSA